MRQVVYSPAADRLVYLHRQATPQYWDAHWRAQGKPPAVSPRDDVLVVTRTHLPAGARVLEGGCGRADKVKALADAGFAAVGVDFAADVVAQAREHYPQLDVRQGDVRSLDFPDGSFDGYWSIGVIEHFWDGYDGILAEAARIVRRGGYLFLSAPWFSPYRRFKARRHDYPTVDFADQPELFYQFALARDDVSARLARHGFELLSWRGRAAEISMREDMKSCKRQIEWLFGSKGSIVKRVLRVALTRSLDPFCGHSFLAVAGRAGEHSTASR